MTQSLPPSVPAGEHTREHREWLRTRPSWSDRLDAAWKCLRGESVMFRCEVRGSDVTVAMPGMRGSLIECYFYILSGVLKVEDAEKLS